MTSNVTLPGTGTVIATDDVAGVEYQVVKLDVGVLGSSVPMDANNPLPVGVVGELTEAIESLRFAIGSLTRTVGLALPDTQGRLRVMADFTGVGTVNLINSVSAVANQAQAGGIAMNEQVPALMRISAASLRSNISVS